MVNFDTSQPAQIQGLGGTGYIVDPIVTIGDTTPTATKDDKDYIAPGIPDGMGAYALNDKTVRLLVNHEIGATAGYAYKLANGTELKGARVSFFDIDKTTRTVVDSGLAYDTIINRQGKEVAATTDLEYKGIQRLCSAQYIPANQFGVGRGLADGLFFTGEETDGGTEFVVDSATNTMYAVPWMGRAAWENVTELDTGTPDKVALLVGDDRGGAPLLMYVGTKQAGSTDLLERNGLKGGQLYVWAAESGETTPEQFKGTGESRNGAWVAINYYDAAQAGTAVDSNSNGSIQDQLGYDADGFATQAQQDALAKAVGAFRFSRPEDVSTNPNNGTQAVLASTGRDSLFPSDSWGTTYTIDTTFNADGTPEKAKVLALYNGDDAGKGQFSGPDFGLRSPDKVALLIGDDRGGAPLTMYVGTKDTRAGASILARNGLVDGKLYAWAANSGETTPEAFKGTFTNRAGKWVEIDIYDASKAGSATRDAAGNSVQTSLGYDAEGFATQAQQDALAKAAGAFQFSRPEDVATNPHKGTQAVLASTGRDSLFPSDSWGTTYTIDTTFSKGMPMTADVKILYNGDDAGAGQFSGPDFGLRSPDNLEWADDGYIYVQEDRSVDQFGKTSGQEASIWRLDPATGAIVRVAQMDRTALPSGQSDSAPTDIGNWESSGIIDVSGLFDQKPGNLFLFDVQAHSLTNGVIASENLVQGGQLAFLKAPKGIPGKKKIVGTSGNDTILGDRGMDDLVGALGNDIIRGGNGEDTLRGDLNKRDAQGGIDGNDTLFGGRGNDRLWGNGGNDILLGEAGNDRIWGNDGDDIIRGGLGKDTLTGDERSGSRGRDTFILAVGEGKDLITDFKVGTDFIGLAGGLSFGSVSITQKGANTFISAGHETLAELTGVTDKLTASAFVTVA